jgi:branched-chain amino acid transport system ATP-binding protein
VLLDRADVTRARPDVLVRQGICHITEGRSIFPSLTVRDNLRLFAPARAEDECVTRAVTAFPKLKQRMSQVAGTMSGGEQQMLSLGRAFGRRAPLVMLDEVSLGLAPIIVDEIFEALKVFASEGTSVLIVEQYVAKALAMADYLYVLAKGRIVFAGEADEATSSDLFARYLGTSIA